MMRIKTLSLSDCPALEDTMRALNKKAWPRFLLQWECSAWANLFSIFASHQILLLSDGENIAAYGHTVPLVWRDNLKKMPDDLKVLVEMAGEAYEKGRKPNILLALAVVVAEDFRGHGLSAAVLKAMKEKTREKGLEKLVVPVRPTLKPKYPLIPIAEYVNWHRQDGLPFDPWLRTHARLGGKIFKTTEASMYIRGTVKEWERWSGLQMLSTGMYVIEGALRPVEVNLHEDMGLYTDPCIWVVYEIDNFG